MSALVSRPVRSPMNIPGASSVLSWHSMLRCSSVVLNTTLYATGSGPPPVVTLTGTLTRFADFRIEVTTGGARGTAVFRWSDDGGTTWTSGVTTAATTVLGTTGITLAWPVGTYATDNVYVGKVVQWNDSSGHGWNYENLLSVNGSQLPRLVKNTTTGRWCLRFQKTAQTFLRIGSSTYCNSVCGGNDTPFTIFTVAGVYGTVGTQHFIHSITDTTLSTSEISLFAYTNSQWGASKRGSSGAEIFTTGGTVDNTGVHVFEHYQPGTTVSLLVDGSAAINAAAQDTPSATLSEAFLGGIRSGANIYGDVDVYAQIVYSGARSGDERGFARQLLKARYNTP